MANPAENKLHSQDIQIPWNQDLNYNNALLDIVSWTFKFKGVAFLF